MAKKLAPNIALRRIFPVALLFYIILGSGNGWSQGSESAAKAGPYGQPFTSANQEAALQDGVSNSRQNAITRAVAEVSPAVVGINVVQVQRYYQRSPFAEDPFFRQFFQDAPAERRVKSLGSGFIISKEGYILTNQHVVAGAIEIIVTRPDGKQYVARMAGEDGVTDLAILKIEGKDFPFVQLGNSDDVIIGEWAIALGNPFGLFDIGSKATVTVGVISATDRDFGKQKDDRIYEDMIQTDAAINAGNSGGPLVNCSGEVIGINTWILSDNGTNIGIGFALPVNRAKRILNELINYGQVDRGWSTGLHYEAMSMLAARYLGLKSRHGVVISKIEPNSPAARAGLEVGDVIMGINGKEVEHFDDVKSIMKDFDLKKGDVLIFRAYRNRRYFSVNVRLDERSDQKGRK
jgi:serine protease Do